MKQFLVFPILIFGMISMVNAGNSFQVYFNEVRVMDAGMLDNREFIELIGPAGTDLTNFQIIHYNGAAATDGEVWATAIGTFIIPNDGVTDVNGNNLGFYVLGDDNVTNLDEDTDWANNRLLDGPAGLLLLDASDNIIDAIAWGSAGDLTTDDPGTVSTSVATFADNYLHVTMNDDAGNNSLNAPTIVSRDDGTGWTVETATPGAINTDQTNGSIVLPVELTAFYGKTFDNQINLKWQTAKEENNSHFEVERSLDSKTFKKIGQVQGHGTTETVQSYNFSDENPQKGSNYYRLKQVDFDGQFEYSGLIVINWSNKMVHPIDVYPNPTKEILNYQVPDLNLIENIQLFDLQGRLVRTTTTFDGSFPLNDIIEGTYMLVIDTQTEQFQQVVIKQ